MSTVPGQSDAELEKEKILNRLGQIMRGLTPRRGSVADPANAAWYLYNIFCLAKAAKRQKEKGGWASPASVAKQLKDIASGSTTLLKRLKNADKNVFEAWAWADEAGVDRHLATQQWLQLKSLLEESSARATRAALATEAVLKAWPKASAARRGRRPDLIADNVTVAAGVVYLERTGELPSRSISWDEGNPVGKFNQFLKNVFDALGIKSSPDSSNMRLQTKLRAMKRRK